jgi:aminopeptidase
MDPRVQTMADVLVTYSLGVTAGKWVIIQSPIAGEPLADALVQSVLRAGAHPTVLFLSEAVSESRYRLGSDEQIGRVTSIDRAVAEEADALVSILAPTNTRALSTIDPERIALGRQASRPLQDLRMQRTARGEYNWNICAYPTPAAAQDAGMSLREYEDFVFNAGLLSEPDPVAAWKALGERQERLVEWLSSRHDIRVTGPGTDLTVSTEGRRWMNDSGHRNFPGGEVFTSPVETSAEGEIRFTFPAFYAGREVNGVRLVYRDGVVVDADADSDVAFLHEMLDLDEGARRLGEFAIGTNYGIQRFTKNTLFDEKIGGTLHMALGAGFEDTGGVNKSALHWDMVYDLRNGGEITADGATLSRNGEFQITL